MGRHALLAFRTETSICAGQPFAVARNRQPAWPVTPPPSLLARLDPPVTRQGYTLETEIKSESLLVILKIISCRLPPAAPRACIQSLCMASLLTQGGQGLPSAPDYPACCLYSAAFCTFDALSQLVNHGKFVVFFCREHATPPALPDGHSEKSNIAEGRKDDPI